MNKNEWVEDDARYAVDGPVGIIEFSALEDAQIYQGRRAASSDIIQRYTDQQMELETQGWTLWNAGDSYPRHVKLEYIFKEMYGMEFAEEGSWEDDGNSIIAYRLSNADGYKDGVKTRQPITPEVARAAVKKVIDMRNKWKDGELPPLNTECEFLLNSKWEACKTVGKDGERVVFYYSELHRYDASKNPDKFRPIQSERDKVITKATEYCKAYHWTAESFLDELYGRGMLSMPDKGEE